jgi:hypothetical protein
MRRRQSSPAGARPIGSHLLSHRAFDRAKRSVQSAAIKPKAGGSGNAKPRRGFRHEDTAAISNTVAPSTAAIAGQAQAGGLFAIYGLGVRGLRSECFPVGAALQRDLAP